MRLISGQSARILLGALSVAMMSVGAWADESMRPMPDMPRPGVEHAWLQQMVGEWDTGTEAYMPGRQTVKSTGTEHTRPLGGFWTITEVKSTMMDMPFTGNMTLGYDTDRKKYVGHLGRFDDRPPMEL